MKVGFHATLRPIVGARSIEIELPEGATVRELVKHLVERWPGLAEQMLDESGELSRRVHVFVDGRSSRFLDGPDTRLDAGQKIDVIPAVAGG